MSRTLDPDTEAALVARDKRGRPLWSPATMMSWHSGMAPPSGEAPG
jgi:hypothetical protein